MFNERRQSLSLCKDTAPAPDGITTSEPEDSQSVLLSAACNMLLESGQYPDFWRREIKLPILKPNRDPAKMDSHCPVSLTSCVCKLLERMVNVWLVFFFYEKNNLLPHQSGFRKQKSTMDAFYQLISYVEKGFTEKKHTLGVSFDLEKAYDTVR